jgi:hypothetical protein
LAVSQDARPSSFHLRCDRGRSARRESEFV